MLVLTRKVTEKLYIGQDICVTVVRLDGGQVRLGIEAPREIPVVRAELVPDDARSVEARRAEARPDEARPPARRPAPPAGPAGEPIKAPPAAPAVLLGIGIRRRAPSR